MCWFEVWYALPGMYESIHDFYLLVCFEGYVCFEVFVLRCFGHFDSFSRLFLSQTLFVVVVVHF